MTEKKNQEKSISRYIEVFLEEHFGEKPEQVEITLRPPFLLIHLSGFLLPSEEILMDKGMKKRIIETRDILFHSIKMELLNGLESQLDRKVEDLFADWNIVHRSGLLIVTLEKDLDESEFSLPQGVNQEILREIFRLNSMRTQKEPDQTNFYWLNEHLLLIERIGILIEIEKQLVRNGVTEELRLAKRPMEYQIIELFNLESILKRQVQDLFVDWNFQRDVSYMVLLLKKENHHE